MAASTAAREKTTIVGNYIRRPGSEVDYFSVRELPEFTLGYSGLSFGRGPIISYKEMGPTPQDFLQQLHRAVMGENVPGTIPIPARNNLAERGGTRKNKRQSRRKTSYRRAK
jgi:hypothetical protein